MKNRGGHDWSDGILYQYPRKDSEYILKIMEMPAQEADDQLASLQGRLTLPLFWAGGESPLSIPSLHSNIHCLRKAGRTARFM